MFAATLEGVMEEKCSNEQYNKCVVCDYYDDCVHRYYVEEGRQYYVIPLMFFFILFTIYILVI